MRSLSLDLKGNSTRANLTNPRDEDNKPLQELMLYDLPTSLFNRPRRPLDCES